MESHISFIDIEDCETNQTFDPSIEHSSSVVSHILTKYFDSKTIVVLIAVEKTSITSPELDLCEHDEVFVSQNCDTIRHIMRYLLKRAAADENHYHKFYVQEYDSFQGAYEVSLHMREPNRICYDK